MTRRILVADDSSTIQKVVKIAFSNFPVEIIEAASFIEALQSLQPSPDLLIVDACLPGAKNAGDYKQLAETAGQAPMLLLIGSYQNVNEDEFVAVGLDQFLKKPFDSAEIVERAEMLLGSLDSSEPETPVEEGADGGQSGGVEIPPLPTMPVAKLNEMESQTNVFDGSLEGDHAPPHSTELPLNTEVPDDDGFSIAPTSLDPAPLEPENEDFHGFANEAGSENEKTPMTDASRKGRKAFEDDSPVPPPPPMASMNPEPGANQRFTTTVVIPNSPYAGGDPAKPIAVGGASADQDTPRSSEDPFDVPMRHDFGLQNPSVSDEGAISDRLPELVRAAVDEYCDKHFKSLAKEVIAAELRRLADEKARHLVDN